MSIVKAYCCTSSANVVSIVRAQQINAEARGVCDTAACEIQELLASCLLQHIMPTWVVLKDTDGILVEVWLTGALVECDCIHVRCSQRAVNALN